MSDIYDLIELFELAVSSIIGDTGGIPYNEREIESAMRGQSSQSNNPKLETNDNVRTVLENSDIYLDEFEGNVKRLQYFNIIFLFLASFKIFGRAF